MGRGNERNMGRGNEKRRGRETATEVNDRTVEIATNAKKTNSNEISTWAVFSSSRDNWAVARLFCSCRYLITIDYTLHDHRHTYIANTTDTHTHQYIRPKHTNTAYDRTERCWFCCFLLRFFFRIVSKSPLSTCLVLCVVLKWWSFSFFPYFPLPFSYSLWTLCGLTHSAFASV